jgi:hypothetical protein
VMTKPTQISEARLREIILASKDRIELPGTLKAQRRDLLTALRWALQPEPEGV